MVMCVGRTVGPNRLPASVQGIAQGDARAIQAALAQLGDASDDHAATHPEKPWIAEALETSAARVAIATLEGDLRAKAGQLHQYSIRLEAATKAIAEQGSAGFEPNIRVGEQGYAWGPSAKHSYILDRLGIVDRQTGEILDQRRLAQFGMTAETKVAERWMVTDDTKYPSWTVEQGVAVPLFWVIRRDPQQALGADHVKAYGEALGMVMKYLDAAEPLSWQVHLGITEGYLDLSAGEGVGLFLGINELTDDVQRRRLIAHVKERLERRDPTVVRLPHQDGVEHTVTDVGESLQRVIDGMHEEWSIAELTAYLLTEGMNVIDVAELGLVQCTNLRPGQRLVSAERAPHALFGNGDRATATQIELKATSVGPSHARQSTAEQTGALADNFLRKPPRIKKVTRAQLEQWLAAIKQAGLWRRLDPGTDLKHHGDEQPVEISPGVSSLLLHREEQYAGRQMTLDPGTAVKLVRYGQHSALMVRAGRIRLETLDGRLLRELGAEEEAFVLASQGDLILRSVGTARAEVIDFKRPVEGVALPEPFRNIQGATGAGNLF